MLYSSSWCQNVPYCIYNLRLNKISNLTFPSKCLIYSRWVTNGCENSYMKLRFQTNMQQSWKLKLWSKNINKCYLNTLTSFSNKKCLNKNSKQNTGLNMISQCLLATLAYADNNAIQFWDQLEYSEPDLRLHKICSQNLSKQIWVHFTKTLFYLTHLYFTLAFSLLFEAFFPSLALGGASGSGAGTDYTSDDGSKPHNNHTQKETRDAQQV